MARGPSRARTIPALSCCRRRRRSPKRSIKRAPSAREHVAREDFEGAMRALASLRAPVDVFFVAVTVNSDDPALRLNRLRLLGALREAADTVADFSKISV